MSNNRTDPTSSWGVLKIVYWLLLFEFCQSWIANHCNYLSAFLKNNSQEYLLCAACQNSESFFLLGVSSEWQISNTGTDPKSLQQGFIFLGLSEGEHHVFDDKSLLLMNPYYDRLKTLLYHNVPQSLHRYHQRL